MVHARVLGVVHEVAHRVRATAGGALGRGTGRVVGRALGVRIAAEVTAGVAVAGAAAALEGVLEAEIVAHLVGPRATQVVRRVVGVAHRPPEEANAVEVGADHTPAVGQVGVAEVPAGGVRVDVQVARRVPADAGGVAPAVVVPVLVPVPRDPRRRVPARVHGREVELDLRVRQRGEVGVEDGDLLEDAGVGNIAGPVVRVQHVEDHGDVVDVGARTRRVVARVGDRHGVGAVTLRADERHRRRHVQRADPAALAVASEEGRGEVLVPVGEEVGALDVVGEDGAILEFSDGVARGRRALVLLRGRWSGEQDGHDGPCGESLGDHEFRE